MATTSTDLTVVLLANTEITVEGNMVRAEAGAVWDDVVVTSLAHGLGGLECLSGIPGSAGATPVQNVGAYGAEVADTISRVRLLDRRTGEDALGAAGRARSSATAPASSRHSRRAPIVLEVEFALDADGPQRAAALRRAGRRRWAPKRGRAPTRPRVRDAVLALRRRKGMVLDAADHDTWSVGSFFTNPVVSRASSSGCRRRSTGRCPNYPADDGVKLAAGWLVERAGFARAIPGDGAPARLSTKHALALTNRGTATSRGRDCAGQDASATGVRDGIRDRTHTRAVV